MEEKGKVCVTGGTGFVASWLILRLLQRGYSVNTTIRSPTADISFLTNLPKASEKLRIFDADLDDPDSFGPAIEGCIGVFHVAHPMDLEDKETEQTITERSVTATLGILRASLDSKTVKRVVYTSGAATVMHRNDYPNDVLDEDSWSDLDYVRSSGIFGASYCISKTVTERAILEFSENHSLDVVITLPTLINGSFICPGLPASVRASLAMFTGNKEHIKYNEKTPFVHIDDVASAHIFLFEYPEARGRYICSAVEVTIDELSELVSKKYPEYKITNPESLVDRSAKTVSLSSKKLLDAGFTYKYGAEEMFNDALECCKQKGSKKDISFLTNLPKASERLRVFYADMDDPNSFGPAIEGCVGVFHVAHPIDFQNTESVDTITDRSVRAALGILQACLDSKTVKRVVYTSSAWTVFLLNGNTGGSRDDDDVLLDEATWSDLDYVRSSNMFVASYCISKTVTERAVLEFGERHCLDVVTVIPSWINGPFICPGLPGSVRSGLAVFMGNDGQFRYLQKTPYVHTDDVASAHIFLFENPEAKGRYICSAFEMTVDELSELVSKKYPEYQISNPESLVDRSAKIASLSSKKLLDAGFTYKYGAVEMFNDAIKCCKQKGLL